MREVGTVSFRGTRAKKVGSGFLKIQEWSGRGREG